MGYDAILTALADPTRRAILDRLRQGARPVGQIAAPLAVTRPAVSQHLKVLVQAGLVTMTPDGRRNLYGLAPGGAAPLVRWLGALSAVEVATPTGGLHRSLAVRITPSEAWQLFCDDLTLWWPVSTISQSALAEGALPQAVELEARKGGLWRETLFDGSSAPWATVVEAIPAERLVLEWSLLAPAPVTVTFAAEPDGTRITLNHASDAPEAADLWDLVLMERYAAAAASSLSNF
ncbi:hypothetical protein JANAI62_23380 [Jannaschia pagri]|uniref:HTH arsR-type domain-containing protein n=1 Tax=Jannaschia pagri TaxID=2829797 RepID=A0ABQ4NN74_9RHOB|nr:MULTISPECIES: metalloregulator ArsR/SmtB family transcription factor [unclassified Jannaschia]GIT91881.1 hypothetical protein JANAI61_23390 [Jannaschia sp. AI_61]GIT95715.1 hypothetical protein JANAI62_23380 [Jannaschia sp. AI_62]